MLNIIKKKQKQTSFLEIFNQVGKRNYSIITESPHRFWPFWLSEQIKNFEKSYGLDNNYFNINNTRYRNWTLLSESMVDNYVLVDPIGLTHIYGSDFSVGFCLSNSHEMINPADCRHIKQDFDNEKQMISTEFNFSKLSLISNTSFSVKGERSFISNQFKIINTNKKGIKLSFSLVIRPYNLEGLTNLNSIKYDPRGVVLLNSFFGIKLPKAPDNIICLSHQDGDVVDHFHRVQQIYAVKCQDSLASALLEYKLNIPEASEQTINYVAPCFKSKKILKINNQINNFSFFDWSKEQRPTKSVLNSDQLRKSSSVNACSIKTPDERCNKLFENNVSSLKRFIGKSKIHSGIYSDSDHSVAHECDMYLALIKTGYKLPFKFLVDFSSKRKRLSHSLKKKQISLEEFGRWVASLEQVLDCLTFEEIAQHDFSDIFRALQSLAKKGVGVSRKQSINVFFKRKSNFDQRVKNVYAADLTWALIALKSASKISEKFNIDYCDNIKHFESELLSYIEEMFLSAVSKQFLTEVIPVTKSVFKDYRVVNVIAGIIQVPELKNKFLSHIKNSIQFINSHLSKNDLLYSISNPAGFPVSSNFEFAKILMSLNNKKGFDIFFHLIQKASSVGVWPTAIHPVSAGGSDREGHDGKASADFILLMMEMLFDDREKDTLTLLKWCPEEWIDTKKPIVVKDARVKYGLFSFTFEKKKDYFKCKINHQFKNLPKLMSIKFPVKVTQIKIGSKWLKNHTKQVVLPFTSEEIMFYFSHEPEKK